MTLDERVPEPELMEDPAQARAYDEADFSVAHDGVVDLLLARRPSAPTEVRRGVDLGCGPADVTVRLARALPLAAVVGLDAGPRMLGLGRDRVDREGLGGRVELRQLHLPAPPGALAALGRFDLVATNSLHHHHDDPATLWQAAIGLAAPGALVHVVDLARPGDDDEVDRLVRAHAAGEPEVLVDDFRNSLRAAYRPDEVVGQLRRVGLADRLEVEVVSDRHLLVHGRLA